VGGREFADGDGNLFGLDFEQEVVVEPALAEAFAPEEAAVHGAAAGADFGVVDAVGFEVDELVAVAAEDVGDAVAFGEAVEIEVAAADGDLGNPKGLVEEDHFWMAVGVGGE